MVFLLCKVLKCAFTYEASTECLALLHDVEQEVERWFNAKPNTFNPIRLIPRTQQRGQRFPNIWMLLPIHGMYHWTGCVCVYILLTAVSVIGLQYYHVAKIVLAVSSSPSPAVGYENLKHLRNIEVCRPFHDSRCFVCLICLTRGPFGITFSSSLAWRDQIPEQKMLSSLLDIAWWPVSQLTPSITR